LGPVILSTLVKMFWEKNIIKVLPNL
jgi:hypothetical protein